MSDRDSPPPAPEDAPAWLGAATLRAMGAARDRALAAGGGRAAAVDAAWAVARAHRPALPATMIAEAVAAVVPGAPRPARASGAAGAALHPDALAAFAASCRAAARAAHHLVMARVRAAPPHPLSAARPDTRPH